MVSGWFESDKFTKPCEALGESIDERHYMVAIAQINTLIVNSLFSTVSSLFVRQEQEQNEPLTQQRCQYL